MKFAETSFILDLVAEVTFKTQMRNEDIRKESQFNNKTDMILE